MAEPILHGASYSVYTRIVRLALLEKGVGHRLEEVDVFGPDGPPAGYLELNPFGRIPTLVHDGFVLYETEAIGRYVDEVFHGPALQPLDARGRARAAQIIGVLDSDAYRPMVWDIFVERVRRPLRGEASDEKRIASAVARVDRCLRALASLGGGDVWLVDAGDRPSLADLHAAPMIAYLSAAPEGAALLELHPRMLAWWRAICARPSMLGTPSPLIERVLL